MRRCCGRDFPKSHPALTWTRPGVSELSTPVSSMADFCWLERHDNRSMQVNRYCDSLPYKNKMAYRDNVLTKLDRYDVGDERKP
jgi:hypothetical protein